MNKMKLPLNFPIEVFDLKELNQTQSIARCAIFYKGANRNGSYITNEFAEELLKSLPYTPVKGIYDQDEEDFSNHGKKRSNGRIYGVVPHFPNVTWEKRTDQKGVEREYAVCDVILYTALYEEASSIPGKGQSMELYEPSIKGEWLVVDGLQMYKYHEGVFLGLQVLGEDVEPCFEEAGFESQDPTFASKTQEFTYSLIFSLLEKLDTLVKTKENSDKEEEMPNTPITFELSARQKENALFKALNDKTFRYYVVDHYEKTAIVVDFETDKILKIAYTVDAEENISVDLEGAEEVAREFVTKEEKKALDELRTETATSIFSEMVTKFKELNTNIENAQTSLNEKDGQITAFTVEKDALTQTISSLEEKIDKYELYKSTVELAQKKAILSKYSKKLDKAVLDEYTDEKLNSFDAQTLEKELAYELVKNDTTIFSLETEGYIPKPEELSGVEAILEKYKKD